MSKLPGDNQIPELILAQQLKSGVDELLKAFQYAQDTNSDLWEFAVPIRLLKKIGLNESDLRWLTRKNYVEHASEVTQRGQDGRKFRPTGDLTFTKRSCFVLTPAGVSAAILVHAIPPVAEKRSPTIDLNSHKLCALQPHWNPEARELRLNGSLVKRFKWQAVNQETVLCAFQEEDWPIVIDDPLPQKIELDSKRRLQDTIKALNRNQEHEAIRFHGNGTGEGVRWEIAGSDAHALN